MRRPAPHRLKPGTTGATVTLHVVTSLGRRAVSYRADVATDSNTGQVATVGLHGKTGDFDQNATWVRLERNLAADVARFWPGAELQVITGMGVSRATGGAVLLDDLSFSNSVTVLQNVMAPGAVGHIAWQRVVKHASNGAVTHADKWLHYDHLGSVAATSPVGGSGSGAASRDAFGNPTLSWSSGRWAVRAPLRGRFLGGRT